MCRSTRSGHVYQPGVRYSLVGTPDRTHNLDMCTKCGVVASDKGTIPLNEWVNAMQGHRDPKRHLSFLGGNEELIKGAGVEPFDHRPPEPAAVPFNVPSQATATA